MQYVFGFAWESRGKKAVTIGKEDDICDRKKEIKREVDVIETDEYIEERKEFVRKARGHSTFIVNSNSAKEPLPTLLSVPRIL